MSLLPGGARLRLLASGAALVASTAVPAFAQAVTTAAAVKGAFLYNFAKFAEWPANALAPGQRLSLCVIGDAAVADALEQTVMGRPVEGHELTVLVLKADGPIRACHLLYASGIDAKQAIQLLETLKNAPVFTVSNVDTFTSLGGVAQLILEKDRMRFAINVTAAKRAHINLSSKLLSLAQIVKDDNDSPR